jgi:hypothetical protein
MTRRTICKIPLDKIKRLHPSLRANPHPSEEEMQWIEKVCDGKRSCDKVCGRLGIVYCPLK